MDTAVELIEGTLLDPVALTTTAAVSPALLTGAAARAIEFGARRPSCSARGAESAGTR